MPSQRILCRKCHVTALACAAMLVTIATATARAQDQGPARPIFVDGQAQIVPAFEDTAQWVRQELWVEAEFDTDGDGKPDRMHVAVVC